MLRFHLRLSRTCTCMQHTVRMHRIAQLPDSPVSGSTSPSQKYISESPPLPLGYARDNDIHAIIIVGCCEKLECSKLAVVPPCKTARPSMACIHLHALCSVRPTSPQRLWGRSISLSLFRDAILVQRISSTKPAQ